jgi:rod shape determining protein RodA|tara:strand:+ start:28062 stop:29315 length:1254 start_codon:yes stop_codon:yes gene_type:complete
MNEINIKKIDWISLAILSLLVLLGLINIYSATHTDLLESAFSLKYPFGKQCLFVFISIIIFFLIQTLPFKFFEKFSSVLYILSILSLIGLFLFGENISGATSWYQAFGFGIQPSEFTKPITALALAKFLSEINVNIKTIKTQFYSFLIILIPIILIIIQPDPGTTLIFLSFFIVFYKIGLPSIYLNLFVGFITLFFLTILFSKQTIILAILFLSIILIFFMRSYNRLIKKILIYSFIFSVFTFSVDLIFNNIFEQHHRDRFNIVMGLKQDDRGIGYNTNQSIIAFASGGISGEGFLKGSQTRGDFVPEQHTDYIFSTVGEEWGFLGASIVLLLFSYLMIRISKRAELQRNLFNKIYAYSTVTILFSHFFINIGMVLGLVPTIGIPLPFISYGGSNLLAFILLFSIYIKLDSQRTSKW